MKIKSKKKPAVVLSDELVYNEVKQYCSDMRYFLGEYVTEAVKEKLKKDKKK